MVAAYRSSSQTTAGYAASNVTATEPTGATTDDILIAWVASGEADFGPPSGWTLGTSGNIAAGAGKTARGKAYWIRRGASAPSYVFTRSGSTSLSIQIVAVSGVDTDVTPVFQIGTNAATTSLGVDVEMPSSGGVIVAGGMGADGAGTCAVSGTLTERQDSGVVEAGFLGPNNIATEDSVSSGTYTATLTNSTSMERVAFACAVPTSAPAITYAYVKSSAGTISGYASGNVTATEPASAAENDWLIAQVVTGEADGLPTLPTGWTSLGTQDAGSGSPRLRVRWGWIRRGASAPSLSFGRNGTTSIDIQIQCVTNASTTASPVFNSAISGGSVTSIGSGSVTVTATRGALVGGSCGVAGAGSAGVSTTDWVEDLESTAESGYNGPCASDHYNGEAVAGSQSATFTNTTSMVRAAFIVFIESEATGAQSITPTGASVSVTPGTVTVATSTAVSPTGPTVTATPGTVTVTSSYAIAPTGPTVSVTPGTVTVTTGAVDVSPTGPTVTVTPGTATVTTSTPITPTGPTVSVTPGTVTVTTTAAIAPTGPTVTVTPGTLTVSQAGATQNITPTGPTVTATPGTVTVTTATAIAPTGATVSVTPGTVTISPSTPITPTGPTVTVTPGSVTVTAGLSVVPDGPTVTATPGTLTVTTGAVAISPTGPTVTVTPGTATVQVGVSAISPTGPTVTATPGTVTVTTGAVDLSPTGPTVSVTAGTLTVAATYDVTPTGPTITVTPGTVTVTTGAAGIAPIGATITVTPGSLTVVGGITRARTVSVARPTYTVDVERPTRTVSVARPTRTVSVERI